MYEMDNEAPYLGHPKNIASTPLCSHHHIALIQATYQPYHMDATVRSLLKMQFKADERALGDNSSKKANLN